MPTVLSLHALIASGRWPLRQLPSVLLRYLPL